MMAPSRRGWSRWLAVACSGGLALLVGGCFVYDAAKPSVAYTNMTDQTVVVTIEGLETPISDEVPGGAVFPAGVRECIGASIVVETEDGELIGRIDKPACPGWYLSINEDYTLTYSED